jgi:N-hydroxyarylamine O-acetyltransferase
MAFDLQAYLARVGLLMASKADDEGLAELHHAQFFSICFENLDIHLGRGIDPGPDRVFDKTVRNARGGYCFELNGLLLGALCACGFEARPLLARVHLEDPPSARTHQLCLVTLGAHQWIADAGFGGGGPRQPLLLEEGASFDDGIQACRLSKRDPWGWVMQTREKEEWKDSYSFDLGVVTAQDIRLGNWYTSTSPTTHFTRVRTVSRPTREGRISLRDNELTEVVHGEGVATNIAPGPEYMRALKAYFSLEVDAVYEDFQAPTSP